MTVHRLAFRSDRQEPACQEPLELLELLELPELLEAVFDDEELPEPLAPPESLDPFEPLEPSEPLAPEELDDPLLALSFAPLDEDPSALPDEPARLSVR
jgi:hypothetical protein